MQSEKQTKIFPVAAKRRHALIWKLVSIALAVLYVLLFIYVVFFARRRRDLHERYLNPIPVVNTIRTGMSLPPRGTRELYGFATNLFGNIFLFVPFSIFLLYFFRTKHHLNVLLAAFILSLSVETIQFVFKIGVADVDDILLNVLGAALGSVLYRKVRRYFFHI